MKLTGAQWKAYLDSWPQGRYYEEDDANIGGIECGELANNQIADTAVVQVTRGVIFSEADPYEGTGLINDLKKWLKSQKEKTFLVVVGNEQVDAFLSACTALKVKVSQ